MDIDTSHKLFSSIMMNFVCCAKWNTYDPCWTLQAHNQGINKNIDTDPVKMLISKSMNEDKFEELLATNNQLLKC